MLLDVTWPLKVVEDVNVLAPLIVSWPSLWTQASETASITSAILWIISSKSLILYCGI